ncbi:MAG: hypothetical protein K2L38_01555, partial [Dysosmobacter sp.]|nr:hypothetical protein [Dysosmobacter sp.]
MLRRFICFLLVVCLLSVPVLAYDYSDTVFGVTFYLHSEGIGTTSRDTVYRINSRAITDEQSQYVASGLYYVAVGAEKAIDAASISQTDINQILNYLNRIEFYLTRLDTSFDGVEGRLENIYAELNKYHRPLLSSILDTLGGLNSNFLNRFGDVFKIRFANRQVFLNNSFADWLYYFEADLWDMLSPSGNFGFLDSSGSVSSAPKGSSFLGMIVQSLLGLSKQLVGADSSALFSFLAPGEDGGLEVQTQEVNNLLDALALLGTSLQNPLAKLQYVLASDDDIELKDSQKENENQFKDNFTGDGDAAVKPSDIGELAGVSSSVKDTFAGAGSPADIFSVLNDSGSFGFFSQEVADILEPSVPAAFSDDPPFDVDALMEEDPEFWGQFDID